MSSVEFWTRKYWRENPTERTFLYYSFLLTERFGKDCDIRTNLKKMVSVQEETSFDTVVRRLSEQKIMTSPELATLTLEAYTEMGILLTSDLGDSAPVLFNGLDIYEAEPDKRWKLWVEKGSQYVRGIFEQIPNMSIKVTDEGRKRGRLIVFETDIFSPVLVFWFVNTHRMVRTHEQEPLESMIKELIFQRQRQFEQLSHQGTEYSTDEMLKGMRVIGITVAPSYSQALVVEEFSGLRPALLLGPINLVEIGHYLQVRVSQIEPLYDCLLDLLDPVHGWRGGLLFAPWIIQYLNDCVS